MKEKQFRFVLNFFRSSGNYFSRLTFNQYRVIANNKSINYGALKRLTVIEFGGFKKEKPIEIYNVLENIRR